MTDREPLDASDRLGTVRPDPRPGSDHAGHDRWLVVRFTTDPGDLTSGETTRARGLLAACTDCAALAADLEVISRATADSITPSRPRDFRLTPAAAATARGGVLDRARRWFGSPGALPVRPLAGMAVTLGLVIAIAAPVMRPSGTARDDGTAETAAKATATATNEPAPYGPQADSGLAAGGSPTLEFTTRMQGTPSPTPAPESVMADAGPSPSPGSDTVAVRPPESPAPTDDQAEGPAPAVATDGGSDMTFALALLGIVLAVVGLLVLLVSWLARRWQDPLLR